MRTRLRRSAEERERHLDQHDGDRRDRHEAEGGGVAEPEVVTDVGQQDREGGAVELVDRVEPEQHGEREERCAEGDRRRAPLVARAGAAAASAGRAPGRSGRIAHAGSTRKLNIIPFWLCSAMWQCAIHRPGDGDVEDDVDGLAGADQHGVLPHEVRLGDVVTGDDEEAAGAVDVERVVHRVVAVHAC